MTDYNKSHTAFRYFKKQCKSIYLDTERCT